MASKSACDEYSGQGDIPAYTNSIAFLYNISNIKDTNQYIDTHKRTPEIKINAGVIEGRFESALPSLVW